MLNEQEWKILRAIELDSLKPVALIAKELKLKAPTVQRTVARLKDTGVLIGRTAVIDLSRLGLTEYGFRLQIMFRNALDQGAFEDALLKNSSVTWAAIVGGIYNYELSIVASSPAGALKRFEKTTATIQGATQRQEMCIRVERHRFWNSIDSVRGRSRVAFHIGHRDKVKSISSAEHAVLKALSSGKLSSLRELAQSIGMSHSSFSQTVHALRRKEILIGLPYRYDRGRAGIMQHRVYLRTRSRGVDLTARVLNSVAQEQSVILVATTLGSFDFELACDLPIGETPEPALLAVRAQLGDDLHSIETAPVFKQLKLIRFPVQLSR